MYHLSGVYLAHEWVFVVCLGRRTPEVNTDSTWQYSLCTGGTYATAVMALDLIYFIPFISFLLYKTNQNWKAALCCAVYLVRCITVYNRNILSCREVLLVVLMYIEINCSVSKNQSFASTCLVNVICATIKHTHGCKYIKLIWR